MDLVEGGFCPSGEYNVDCNNHNIRTKVTLTSIYNKGQYYTCSIDLELEYITRIHPMIDNGVFPQKKTNRYVSFLADFEDFRFMSIGIRVLIPNFKLQFQWFLWF